MDRYDLVCSECRKECAAEFLGTYLLVLTGAGAVIISSMSALNDVLSLLTIGLSFGSTVALVILLLGKFSGAHINPAVTLAHRIAGKMRDKRFFIQYLTFQTLGGLLASVTLLLLFDGAGMRTYLGSTLLSARVSPFTGILLELVGTLLLCLSALAATSNTNDPVRQAALVGGTLFLLIVLIAPYTGASFNPARSLGPSMASGYLKDQYVYLIAPAIGAALAGLLFRLIPTGKTSSE